MCEKMCVLAVAYKWKQAIRYEFCGTNKSVLVYGWNWWNFSQVLCWIKPAGGLANPSAGTWWIGKPSVAVDIIGQTFYNSLDVLWEQIQSDMIWLVKIGWMGLNEPSVGAGRMNQISEESHHEFNGYAIILILCSSCHPCKQRWIWIGLSQLCICYYNDAHSIERVWTNSKLICLTEIQEMASLKATYVWPYGKSIRCWLKGCP